MSDKAENVMALSNLYNGRQEIYLIEVERVNAHNIDWGLIETLKVGIQINTIYEGAVKTRVQTTRTSHVFVFMNDYPDLSNLALDRWHIIDNLGDDQTIHELFPADRFPAVANLVDPFDEDFRDHAMGVPREPSPPRHRRRLLENASSSTQAPEIIMLDDDRPATCLCLI
jgi:hypothetical protein